MSKYLKSQRREDVDWQELMKFREELDQELEKIKSDMNSELSLKLVYDVQHETHSGECSDSDDELEVICKTVTEIVGLPSYFYNKNDDIMKEFKIATSDEVLQKIFAKQPVNCKLGSGHCGCKTTYRIVSATGFNPNASINYDPSYGHDDIPVYTSVTIEEIIF